MKPGSVLALAIHSALPTYAYYSRHLGTRGNYLQAPGNHLQARHNHFQASELYLEARGADIRAREAFILELPNRNYVESKVRTAWEEDNLFAD